MTWTVAEDLKAQCDRVVAGEGSLGSDWDAAIARSLLKSEHVIEQILVGRGLALTQVTLALWPAGAGYALDIGTYFFLLEYYGGEAEDERPDVLISSFDRRDELRLSTLVGADGLEIEPASEQGLPALVEPEADRDDADVHDYPFRNPRTDQSPPWPDLFAAGT